MSGMKLEDMQFIRLLPVFTRGDLSVLGIAAALDEIVPPLTGSIGLLTTWDKINELSEEELDELAWELNILWYEKGAPIETKRDIILNSDKVYRKLGTKWAAENVITSYFGEGYIREWFEYSGEPGHFRVYSTNPSITSDQLNAFMNILNKVKRHSSKLDGIFITLTGLMKPKIGVGMREVSTETYYVKSR